MEPKMKIDGDEPRNDGRVFREAEIVAETRDAGDGKTETIVRATVSSETPYQREMWDDDEKRWVRCHEVLGHGKDEIDRSRMKDGLVIQDTHFGDQVGIIRKPMLKDGKLGGVIEFGCGARAQEIARDAAAGIRRNMSVGYIVNEYRKDGVAKDGLPIFRVTKWTPYEASFVNVPADTNIGVGRVADTTGKGEAGVRAAGIAAVTSKEKEMDAKTIAALMAKAERAHMKAADVSALIEAGKTEPEIANEIAERACAYAEELAKKPAMPTQQSKTAISDSGDVKTIMKQYDLMKVVRSLAGERGVDDGFEREISDEIAKKAGRRTKNGGFFIPEQILAGRAMSVGLDSGANGGKLVATDTLFSEMVPALVAEPVLGRAGARTLTGLVGNVEIPTAGAATAYWVSTEGGDATATTPAIGQIEARMHTVGAYTDITRNLMAQSGIGIQSFVADALRNALARAIESAAFSGDGTAGAPTGLDNASILTVASATNPGLDKILSFVSKINDENALGASMKFIGSPSVWAKLASTVAYEAVGEAAAGIVSGKFLLDTETDKVQGYDFIKSNLSTAKTLYFGDWSKLLLAFWSGIELTVDPYSLSKSGGVRLVALQGMDVVVTQPKAFAKGVVLT